MRAQFRVNRGQRGARRLQPRRGIDHVDQHAGALQMAQESDPQPRAGVGSLDQPGDVGQREHQTVLQLRDPQVGMQRGERIGGDLGVRAGEGTQQCRLARVGQPDQAHVSDQLELQVDASLLARFAQLGCAGSAPGCGGEARVAAPTAPAARHHKPGVTAVEIDEHAVALAHHRARGHVQQDVGAIAPTAPAGAAGLSGMRAVAPPLAKRTQRRIRRVRNHDHVTAVATVAAVRPAGGHIFLVAKARCPSTAGACRYVQVDRVEKDGCGRASRYPAASTGRAPAASSMSLPTDSTGTARTLARVRW